MRGIRTERYKYIRSFETRPFYFPPNVDAGFTKELARESGYFERIRPFEFLFDLKSDPLERENMIDSPQYKNIATRLKKKLARWMEKTDDPLLKGPVPLPEGAVVTPPWAYEATKLWTDEGI
jgi:N-sulfoglucosamine sulfohydrolase